SVQLSETGPYVIQSIIGLGDVDADIQMQAAPYQQGRTYIDSKLIPRFINIEVLIKGTDDEDISTKREHLGKVCNPVSGQLRIQYEYGGRIKETYGAADHVPRYLSGEGRSRTHQIAVIDLTCPNPFWRTLQQTQEPTFEPRFRFPISGPFIFGIQRDRRQMINDGDSPAPIFVEFHGPALNPMIINNTTGEFIKINQELLEGEIMEIDTEAGTVFFVEPDGTRRNVFNWIDDAATFFELVIGENDIEYTADSDIQGAIVNITYSKLYNAI
ncbi:phage distal tail protein, partial [Jeotgalibacillus aurantiacus]|uniref:phage distal tail protein n=1 Tax=Jeotgalibacillus aurantiacus TaxID=2763266 RepID=UPI001D0A6896